VQLLPVHGLRADPGQQQRCGRRRHCGTAASKRRCQLARRPVGSSHTLVQAEPEGSEQLQEAGGFVQLPLLLRTLPGGQQWGELGGHVLDVAAAAGGWG